MKSEVVFADAKLKKAFDELKDSDTEDKRLYEQILLFELSLGKIWKSTNESINFT